MELFDAHAHLGYREPSSVADEIARATDAGVTRITHIASAGSIDACKYGLVLAEAFDNVWTTVGYHPHEAAACSEQDLTTIETLAAHPKVRAIGETGLDYHYMRSPRETQQKVFRQFVRLALRVNLPLVVHSREADDDTVRILREEGADGCGGVIHCFSTTWTLAEAALDLGFYVSFSGILTFKTAEPLRDMARRIPENRLMVETDAPFLAPVPYRGKRNEPAWVVETARCLAQTRNTSLEHLAPVLTQNTARFYGIEL